MNVAKLDVPTIEAVEADTTLTQESGVVVAVVAMIGSLGLLFSGSIWGFIASIIVMLAGWWIWGWLASFVAQKVFGVTTTDTGEMLRVTGYAYVPQLLGVFNFILPIFGFIGGIWTLVALVVGVRQAGEMSTGQAILTSLIAAVPWFVAMMFVTAIFF